MTPNQKRALSKGLAALETMADLWAAEVRLTDMAARISSVADEAERAKRTAAMIHLGFVEGAYRHFIDHQDDTEHAAAPIDELTQAAFDERAVDRFVEAMKAKLADARTKGRRGWQHCEPQDLSRMLREHVEKGDPRDVANFCAFLWNMGESIAAPALSPAEERAAFVERVMGMFEAWPKGEPGPTDEPESHYRFGYNTALEDVLTALDVGSPTRRAASANETGAEGTTIPEEVIREQEALNHPATQVFFRAGLLACREYMARFVEHESPTIATSIRANWWPSLGNDFGAPRKLYWNELTEGEYGEDGFRAKSADEISPTQEALPIALQFLESLKRVATIDMGLERSFAAAMAAEAVAFEITEQAAAEWASRHDVDHVLKHFSTQRNAIEDARTLHLLAAAPQPAQAGARVGLTDAARDVLDERHRQIYAEGWTPAHDDQHDECEMALAAIVYAESAVGYHPSCPDTWPWSPKWFKPTTPRRDLVKAGALILAELERLDRAALLNGADHDQ
ncbi:hypothetical protein AQ742_29580 [Burkholderia pseudomallei]|nr:hypothetical protein AQ742_29580 [Burkholderia pseudomallei]